MPHPISPSLPFMIGPPLSLARALYIFLPPLSSFLAQSQSNQLNFLFPSVASPPDNSKTTKIKPYNSHLRRVNSTKLLAASSKLLFCVTLLLALFLLLFFTIYSPSLFSSSHDHPHHHLHLLSFHSSLALKKRVVDLDNFNSYYDPSLELSRQSLLSKHGIFIVEADLNDTHVLSKHFDIIPFTHVLHLAAQAGVRYAMQNPQSYVSSNVVSFINLLEIARAADPQPAIVWASSSSIYGLNIENPFSESHRTDQPASLYAVTKKAGEEIAHMYNHIYGLSITRWGGKGGRRRC